MPASALIPWSTVTITRGGVADARKPPIVSGLNEYPSFVRSGMCQRDVGAREPQEIDQDDGAGHAVDVVVAVDEDALALPDGQGEPRRRLRHVEELRGLLERRQPRLDPRVRVLRGPQAAVPEQRRERGRDAEAPGQLLLLGLVTGADVPRGLRRSRAPELNVSR